MPGALVDGLPWHVRLGLLRVVLHMVEDTHGLQFMAATRATVSTISLAPVGCLTI